MIKSENYITIQGWMRTELHLKGNDLLVYALIYGFSQTEGQKFTGTLQYIADWCGATKQGVLKNLKNLIDAELIYKEEVVIDGKKHCHYTTQFNDNENTIKHSLIDNSTQFNGTVKHSLTNNTVVNNNSKKYNKNNTKVLLEEKSSSTNFLKSFPTIKTKQNKYSKCVSMINDYTTDKKLREALINYLNLLLEIDPKIYANQFKGKLNQLARLSNSEKEQIKIVNQSIQYGWKSFYPLKEFTGGNYSGGFKDNIKGDTRDLPPLEECLVDRKF